MSAVKTLLTPERQVAEEENEPVRLHEEPGSLRDCPCAPCRALRDAVANHKPEETAS